MTRPRPSPLDSGTPRPPTHAEPTASAWARYSRDWTDSSPAIESMPAAPQTVALYLGHLAAEGKSLATINPRPEPQSPTPMLRRGYPKTDNPARHPVVAEAIKGWRNQAPEAA